MASGAKKVKPDAPASGVPSSAPAALGPFAADCANTALREEVKKIYAAIFKKLAAKEGMYDGALLPPDPRGASGWKFPHPPGM